MLSRRVDAGHCLRGCLILGRTVKRRLDDATTLDVAQYAGLSPVRWTRTLQRTLLLHKEARRCKDAMKPRRCSSNNPIHTYVPTTTTTVHLHQQSL